MLKGRVLFDAARPGVISGTGAAAAGAAAGAATGGAALGKGAGSYDRRRRGAQSLDEPLLVLARLGGDVGADDADKGDHDA